MARQLNVSESPTPSLTTLSSLSTRPPTSTAAAATSTTRKDSSTACRTASSTSPFFTRLDEDHCTKSCPRLENNYSSPSNSATLQSATETIPSTRLSHHNHHHDKDMTPTTRMMIKRKKSNSGTYTRPGNSNMSADELDSLPRPYSPWRTSTLTTATITGTRSLIRDRDRERERDSCLTPLSSIRLPPTLLRNALTDVASTVIPKTTPDSLSRSPSDPHFTSTNIDHHPSSFSRLARRQLAKFTVVSSCPQNKNRKFGMDNNSNNKNSKECPNSGRVLTLDDGIDEVDDDNDDGISEPCSYSNATFVASDLWLAQRDVQPAEQALLEKDFRRRKLKQKLAQVTVIQREEQNSQSDIEHASDCNLDVWSCSNDKVNNANKNIINGDEQQQQQQQLQPFSSTFSSPPSTCPSPPPPPSSPPSSSTSHTNTSRRRASAMITTTTTASTASPSSTTNTTTMFDKNKIYDDDLAMIRSVLAADNENENDIVSIDDESPSSLLVSQFFSGAVVGSGLLQHHQSDCGTNTTPASLITRSDGHLSRRARRLACHNINNRSTFANDVSQPLRQTNHAGQFVHRSTVAAEAEGEQGGRRLASRVRKIGWWFRRVSHRLNRLERDIP